MKPEIKKLWVDALRSGDYIQGRGGLRGECNDFCCLGVLCDLHAKATGRKWSHNGCHYEYLSQMAFLPNEVTEWAGLDTGRPKLPDGTLDTLNDAEMDFITIAGRVEAHL